MSGFDTAAHRLGSNIRAARTKLGLSQEDFAEVAGLHRTYISSVERGERNVSLYGIIAIARALKITPAKLLEGVL